MINAGLCIRPLRNDTNARTSLEMVLLLML
jgi:hypothetical protein